MHGWKISNPAPALIVQPFATFWDIDGLYIMFIYSIDGSQSTITPIWLPKLLILTIFTSSIRLFYSVGNIKILVLSESQSCSLRAFILMESRFYYPLEKPHITLINLKYKCTPTCHKQINLKNTIFFTIFIPFKLETIISYEKLAIKI